MKIAKTHEWGMSFTDFEPELVESLALELGVSPCDGPTTLVAVGGTEGRMYSLLELIFAHVQFTKNALNREDAA